MKKSTLFAGIIILTISVFAQNKEKREVDDFNQIHLRTSANVYLTQGAGNSVELVGDDETLEDIETRVRNGRLVIEWAGTDSWFSWGNRDRIDIYITIKEIEDLSVSGSGNLVSENDLSANNLSLSVNGSGKIEISVDAEDMDISISGSGRIEVNGNSGVNELDISGSGRFLGEDMKAASYDVEISGSGTAKINVSEAIYTQISGSGSVYYKGNPQKVRSDVSGSGRVRKL